MAGSTASLTKMLLGGNHMTNGPDLLAKLGLRPLPAVRWGETSSLDSPGVYVIALPASLQADYAEISHENVDALLNVRPELAVDGQRPTLDQLANRLESLWIPGQRVVYIGLSKSSVRKRLSQFYKTKIGANGPHAGGWPLKMLAALDQLEIHVASTSNPELSELTLIHNFRAAVDHERLTHHPDPSLPLPFANLTMPRGRRKAHGITGARAPKAGTSEPRLLPQSDRRPERPPTTGAIFDQSAPHSGESRTQRVTLADLAGGRIRVPSESKHHFPGERSNVDITLRGTSISAVRWDPKFGSDRERSGVLSIPKWILSELVAPDEVLEIRSNDGRVQID